MTGADVEDGLRLCRLSGWNQRAEDWQLLLRLGDGCFRVAVEHGRVVGTAGAARYGSRLAWICMVLVDPAARGRGIGTRLFEEVLGLVDDVEVVGLDATPAGRPVYAKLGFADAAGLLRMGTSLPAAGRLDPGGAQPLTPARLKAVCALDHEVFGADRGAVLRWALETAPEYAWSLEEDGVLAGYCFGRHGHHSEHLGPVVARGAQAALRLVSAGLSRARAGRAIVDVPKGQAEWRGTLAALGFEEQRPLTRMYRGAPAGPGQPGLQLAIAGPELG